MSSISIRYSVKPPRSIISLKDSKFPLKKETLPAEGIKLPIFHESDPPPPPPPPPILRSLSSRQSLVLVTDLT